MNRERRERLSTVLEAHRVAVKEILDETVHAAEQIAEEDPRLARFREIVAELKASVASLDLAADLMLPDETSEPECVVHMGCLCAGHARGNAPTAPCTTQEEPNAKQLAALHAWARRHGRTWKAKLNVAWSTGRYNSPALEGPLQQVRNTFGPSWLVKFKLPVEEP